MIRGVRAQALREGKRGITKKNVLKGGDGICEEKDVTEEKGFFTELDRLSAMFI